MPVGASLHLCRLCELLVDTDFDPLVISPTCQETGFPTQLKHKKVEVSQEKTL